MGQIRRFLIAWVVLTCTARLCNAAQCDIANPCDPPTHYYDGATDTTGAADPGFKIRSNLHAIISANFTGRSYGDSRYNMGTFEFDTITPKISIDGDPNDPSKILLAYNRSSIPGKWDSGATWNREHVWPKFWLNVTSSQVNANYIGPASDAFELRPADPNINSTRSDLPYGLYPATSGSGGAYGINGGYWFPGTPDAGEVARAIFYMATRYFNPLNASRGTDIQNLQLKNGLSTKFNMGDLNSYLHWHYQYSVDTFERNRNQMIYGSSGDLTNHALNPNYYQGNRNPFIDHPEWVWSVYVGQNNDAQIAIAGTSIGSDGGSMKNIDLGRVFTGAAVPSAQSVSLVKAGVAGTYYDVTPSGAATSTVTGRFNAFAMDVAGNKTFNVGLDTNPTTTATAGVKSGAVTVDNLDVTSGYDGATGNGHGANDANDTINVSLTVLDHATPSWSGASSVDSLTYDFGTIAQGATDPTFGFNLFDFGTNPAYTANLDFDSVTPSGDSGVLTTDLAGSAGILSIGGGLSHAFAAMLDTATVGVFSATYHLLLSDENIAGAQDNKPLTLTLTGNVAASTILYGDYNGNGIVDAADYTVWRDTLGTTGLAAYAGADGDGDGMIGQNDYQVWVDNFGHANLGPGSGASAGNRGAVPEPSSVFLVLVGVIAMLPATFRRVTSGHSGRHAGRPREARISSYDGSLMNESFLQRRISVPSSAPLMNILAVHEAICLA
jgi:endonuclease I